MSHKKADKNGNKPLPVAASEPRADSAGAGLELVLKCGADGSREAVEQALAKAEWPGRQPVIIHSGVGEVNKSDLLLAETASRLVVGFEVGVTPRLDEVLRNSGVEVRLYQVIYRLVDDLRQLAQSLEEKPATEQIIGQARVIALFKSSRHGIILGCAVNSGRLALGEKFRVIGAMGVLYEGKIESLHIDKSAVKQATPPQQVGLKIEGFQHAAVGDLVESFRPLKEANRPWTPSPGVLKRWSD
jgi:translation initiation factor IF-2